MTKKEESGTEQLGQGKTVDPNYQEVLHLTLCDECYVYQQEPTMLTVRVLSRALIVYQLQSLTTDLYTDKLSQSTVNFHSIAVHAAVAFRTSCLGNVSSLMLWLAVEILELEAVDEVGSHIKLNYCVQLTSPH